jgi:hypothetical protein
MALMLSRYSGRVLGVVDVIETVNGNDLFMISFPLGSRQSPTSVKLLEIHSVQPRPGSEEKLAFGAPCPEAQSGPRPRAHHTLTLSRL